MKPSAEQVGSPSIKPVSTAGKIMAHGFHPNPSQYAKVESGESLRPGDYYRRWVNAYAKAGFNVLVPDYRGHNDSEGSTYTHQAGKVEFPEQFYAAGQLGEKVKLVSLWSSAKYRFPKINVAAKYVIHHGKDDAVTPISNIEFYLQNYKERLLKTFLYESEQHLLSADDFDHAVSTDIQLIREIDNGNH